MRLYIGGLSSIMNDDSLRRLFASAGTITRAFVVEPGSEEGRNRGFGFVEMPDFREARAAIRRFNGQTVDGQYLVVSEALPPAGERPWHGGSVYRCWG